MTERYDAIVIGVGQAAPALCARLDKEGLRTALIERKLLGGTCVNNGCVPTKTLIASARAAHFARRGGDYGFGAGVVSPVVFGWALDLAGGARTSADPFAWGVAWSTLGVGALAGPLATWRLHRAWRL